MILTLLEIMKSFKLKRLLKRMYEIKDIRKIKCYLSLQIEYFGDGMFCSLIYI